MDALNQTCFHCHGPLTADTQTIPTSTGDLRVCSAPCATAVKSIHASGLQDFYQHRDTPRATEDQADQTVTDWRTYERPAVMREFVRTQDNGTLIADLLVQGVHCAACTWLIENTLKKIPGVLSVAVNPVTTRGELHFDPNRTSLANLLAQIESIG